MGYKNIIKVYKFIFANNFFLFFIAIILHYKHNERIDL